jgi:hypothetical protein
MNAEQLFESMDVALYGIGYKSLGSHVGRHRSIPA